MRCKGTLISIFFGTDPITDHRNHKSTDTGHQTQNGWYNNNPPGGIQLRDRATLTLSGLMTDLSLARCLGCQSRGQDYPTKQ